MVRLRSLYTILRKGTKSWRSEQRKEDWVPRGGKLWEGKYVEKLEEDKDYFSRVCLYGFILVLPSHHLQIYKTPLERFMVVLIFLKFLLLVKQRKL